MSDLPTYTGADDERLHLALSVSTGKELKHWRRRTATRPEFVATFLDPITMPRRKESAGGLLGGLLNLDNPCEATACNRVHKRADLVAYRSMLTLDADAADAGFIDRVTALGWRGLVHSSFSHRLPGKGDRYRPILFPDRALTPDEYERLALLIQEMVGQRCFDDGSHQYVRTMYRPACADPETYEVYVLDGDLVPVDFLLDLAPPLAVARRRAGVLTTGSGTGRFAPGVPELRGGPFDYDADNAVEILCRHGWTEVAEGEWARPGGSLNKNATLKPNADGAWLLNVFTTKDESLRDEHFYTASMLRCVLEDGGDWRATYDHLIQHEIKGTFS